jgi:hypothetical protein
MVISTTLRILVQQIDFWIIRFNFCNLDVIKLKSMKLYFTPILFSVFAGVAFSQSNEPFPTPNEVITINALGQEVLTTTNIHFRVVTPSIHWNVIEDEENLPKEIHKDGREKFDVEGYEEALLKGDAGEKDPLVQSEMGTRQLREPIVNFNGLSGSGVPPDPSGAAGPNHYVQAVNTSVRVYTKTGSAVPGATYSLASFWSGSSNEGDPIVLYDRHADRWFISQFQSSPNQILIAISETNDPTGNYYEYTFTLTQFPDYPKYSIWWDGYYMTSNSNHTAVAFERDKMLAGNPSAQMISLSLPSLNNFGFRSPLSADADGDLPPNGTPCYFFNLEDDAFNGVSQDQIEIYEMTCNWSNPGSSAVVSSQVLPVAAFDALFSGGWSNIDQPSTSQGLDAIMGVIMFRAQHMRWSGYNSMVLTHAVDLGSNRSGIRWYELRDANDGNWSVFQSGTYAPENTNSRWMSSAAMDAYGNIGMGYSISGPSTFPGLAYTGRLSTDPAGTMSFGENVAIDGLSSQTWTDRYGDYAHLSLDPDGATFWYTGEYMGTNETGRTRIFSFRLAGDAGLENPYYTDLSMNVFQSANDLQVKVSGIHNNEKVELQVVGMNGQTLLNKSDVQPVNGELSNTFDVSNLAAGVYFVSVGNVNFQEVERIYIQR